MVVTGYVIHTCDMNDVMMKINEVIRKLNREADRLYGELLGEEAAFLYDCLATNALKEPENMEFLDWTVNELNMKIQTCQKSGASCKYNFKVYVQFLPYREDTYIKTILSNKRLEKAFGKLEDYSLTETENLDQNNTKTQTWQMLHKIYRDSPVFTMDLSPALKPDMDDIKIPDKNKRCTAIARRNLTNRNLSQISGGRQIPPYLLMPFMDTAIEMLSQSEIDRLTAELSGILPDTDAIMDKLKSSLKDSAEEQAQ